MLPEIVVGPAIRHQLRDGTRRDLVARGDEASYLEPLFGDACAADQLMAGNDHIIVGVQANHGRRRVHSLLDDVRPLPRFFFVQVHGMPLL